MGNISNEAMIFGSTRYEEEFTPITSSASICSVILMVPNSPAIFDPTFPANTIAIIVGDNSNSVMSLTTNDIT